MMGVKHQYEKYRWEIYDLIIIVKSIDDSGFISLLKSFVNQSKAISNHPKSYNTNVVEKYISELIMLV